MELRNEPNVRQELNLAKIVIVSSIIAGIIGIILFIISNLAPSEKTFAAGVTRYAVASGNWNSTSTWSTSSGGSSGASIPVAGDIVYIGEGSTARSVTIPSGYTANCATLYIGSTSYDKSNSLTLSSATSELNVSGDAEIRRPSGSNTNALNVNSGTATIGDDCTLAGSSTTTSKIAKIDINSGSLTVTGDLVAVVGSTSGNKIDMGGGSGFLYLGGSFNAQNCTFVQGTGTVVYNGTSAQTINYFGSGSYFNLSINNTSDLGATLVGAITTSNVKGDLAIGDINTGSLFNTSIFNITLNNSKTLTVAEGSTINGLTSVIAFGTSGTATINGTFKTANLTGFSGSSTTAIKSTNSPTIVLGSNSKIEYIAALTQVITARTDYDYLTITSGIKTISSGTLTIAKDLVIEAGAVFSGGTNDPTLNVGGNFINNGTFTQGSGTLTLNGTGIQTIGGTRLTTFNDLVINNTCATAPQVVLDTTITINTDLTLTDGIISVGDNNIIMDADASLSGYSKNSFVFTGSTGVFKWLDCAENTNRFFPVGLSSDTAGYSPIKLTFNNNHETDDYSVLVDSVITSNGSKTGTKITSNVIKATWHVSEGVDGGSNLDFKFEWRTSREGSSLNRNKDCQLLHYGSSGWERPNGKKARITGSGPFYITFSGYTGSFSPFGVEGDDGTIGLTFNGTPSVSGTAGAVGTKYTWNNVGTSDNITIKAVIEIISKTGGASLENIDDASTGSVEAWQPIVNGSQTNGNCWAMEFRVRFYNASTNQRLTLTSFKAQGIDIDGDNEYIREYNRFDKPTGYSVESNTYLTITSSLGNHTFKGPTTTEDGIDITKTRYNVTCDYTNTDSFNIVLGGCCDGGDCETFLNTRRHSINFYEAVPYVSPLPVDMIYFNSEIQGTSTILTWATATEINNSHFEVQRSSDGKSWTKIGRVEGNGNSSRIIKYDFVDDEPLQLNYYRLKQMDFDGKFEYCKTTMVSFNDDLLPAKLLYPSLIHQGENTPLNISNVPAGASKITVTDIKGTVITEFKIMQPETGMLALTDLNTAILNKGIHFITLTSESASETFKIMVK